MAVIDTPGSYTITVWRTLNLILKTRRRTGGVRTHEIPKVTATDLKVVAADSKRIGKIIDRLAAEMLTSGIDVSWPSKLLLSIDDERVVPYFVKALELAAIAESSLRPVPWLNIRPIKPLLPWRKR